MTAAKQDTVTRDRADATYHIGDEAVFDIRLGPATVDAHLCLSLDGHKVLLHKPLGDRHVSISKSLETPGVLRCRVNGVRDGERFSMISAAAFDPEDIEPTTTLPEDFDDFWEAQ